jgi:hypothetical protein
MFSPLSLLCVALLCGISEVHNSLYFRSLRTLCENYSMFKFYSSVSGQCLIAVWYITELEQSIITSLGGTHGTYHIFKS